jgi:hypothetical protein
MKYKIFAFIVLPLCCMTLTVFAQDKKIGIIGLDTSHSIEFTKMLNDPNSNSSFKEFRVVAAYPNGSRTIKSSYERIPKYIETVKAYEVEIVGSIAELLQKVDYVMLETNDGTMHLEQAVEVLKAGKTMFIDKPIAANLPDAIAIFTLAKKYNVPIYSSSSMRYTNEIQELASGKHGKILGVDSYGPAFKEPSHPDFSWYGIHAVEALYTVMGTGCDKVSRTSADSSDVVVGLWKDGRIGSFRGNVAGKYAFGGVAFTYQGAFQLGNNVPYDALLKNILTFFKTKTSPISEVETLEIFTFMAASNESKKLGGIPVSMQKTFVKAQQEAQKILRRY